MHMTPEEWRDLESLVDEALELPGPKRAKFLVDRCGSDLGRLEQALDLLLASGEAQALATPAWPLASPASDTEPATAAREHRPGHRIGSFHVLRELGRGGMGTVFLAEQQTPVARQVAIKVSHSPLGDEGRLRLAAERQALARLSHPYIAQFLEAGSTDDDHPYFAMERVEGIPITELCDARRLDIEARIRLFLDVCAGVQHAHQKGILHRDLKPSNILVTEVDGRAVPKIIDFGIAKALDHPLVDQTLETGGRVLGTPVYLCPEALADPGAAPDTRGDVYSLGVLLQELLLGERPFARAGGDTPFILWRLKTEQEPPSPSRHWREIDQETREVLSGQRATEPRNLARHLRRDLDWIVLRALARDPRSRYAAVSELAGDLERHLADEPVLAGPPSAVYQLRKLIRRHRVAVSFTSLLILALAAGLVARSVEAKRANDQAAEANAARDETEQVVDFLVGLFDSSSANQHLGDEPSASEILAEGVKRLENELATSPTIRARLLHTAARVYRSLGDFEQGLRLAGEALAIRRRELGPSDPALVDSLVEVGKFESDLSRYDRGLALFEEALGHAEPVREEHPSKLIEVLKQLASHYENQHRYDMALRYHHRALELIDDTYGPDSIQSAPVLRGLAFIHSRNRDHDEADRLLRRTLALQEENYGLHHPYLARTLKAYGQAVGWAGRTRDSITFYQQALEIEEKALGPSHPFVAHTLTLLGNAMRQQGHWDDAERHLLRALDIWIPAVGAEHSWVATASHNLGTLYWAIGRDEQAIDHLSRSLEIQQATREDTDPQLATSFGLLGMSQRGAGLPELADQNLKVCQERLEASGHSDFVLSTCLAERGLIAIDQGRLEAAEELLEHAYSMAEKGNFPGSRRGKILHGRAELARARGQFGQARELARQAISQLEQYLPPGHRDHRDAAALLEALSRDEASAAVSP